MSLLMDALRKAERARAERERAEQAGTPGAETGAESSELRLDEATLEPAPSSAEDSVHERPGAESSATSSEERWARVAQEGIKLEDSMVQQGPGVGETGADAPSSGRPDAAPLSLEPRNGDPEHSSVEVPLDDSAELDLSSASGEFPRRDIDPNELSQSGPIFSDDTAATLPSIKSARASVDDYFDGTHSASMSMDGTLSQTDETTITGQRAHVERNAQDAARAVFDAKRRGDGRATRWGLFIVLPLVLVVASAGAYFYWVSESSQQQYRSTASVRPTASSARALDGTSASARDQAATARGTPTSAVGGAAARQRELAAREQQARSILAEAGITASGAAGAAAAQSEAMPRSGDLSPAAVIAREQAALDAQAQAQAPAMTEAAPTDPTPSVDVGPPVMSDAQFEALLARTSSVPRVLGGGAIKIAKGRRIDPAQKLLRQAYQAYSAGEFGQSRRLYARVLERWPRNRDALLGLGAIATGAGEYGAAHRAYAKVLALNPKDSVALAAISALGTGGEFADDESRLQEQLVSNERATRSGSPSDASRNRSERGHLIFALGNLYAQQERWAEAQSAYFEAHTADASNPDYSFNLAVALDQLGQSKAARQYYETALSLIEQRRGSFDPAAVLQRLASIDSN